MIYALMTLGKDRDGLEIKKTARTLKQLYVHRHHGDVADLTTQNEVS
jgi:hypothetical protein